MTVAELIEHLSEHAGHLPVTVHSPWTGDDYELKSVNKFEGEVCLFVLEEKE